MEPWLPHKTGPSLFSAEELVLSELRPFFWGKLGVTRASFFGIPLFVGSFFGRPKGQNRSAILGGPSKTRPKIRTPAAYRQFVGELRPKLEGPGTEPFLVPSSSLPTPLLIPY